MSRILLLTDYRGTLWASTGNVSNLPILDVSRISSALTDGGRTVQVSSPVGGVPARHTCTIDKQLDKINSKSLTIEHISPSDKASRPRALYGIEPIE